MGWSGGVYVRVVSQRSAGLWRPKRRWIRLSVLSGRPGVPAKVETHDPSSLLGDGRSSEGGGDLGLLVYLTPEEHASGAYLLEGELFAVVVEMLPPL
eukprot:NODE_4812_length_639_cov_112.928082.p1 GENE.NODE_4812_length_639_cov_112.928082~~NODE_4812_length_639_cov_112.928082.p1  ORF type:complete len:97 (+),score=10.75 NODE_4812_length_639_cov_112.928082:3-293(+)